MKIAALLRQVFDKPMSRLGLDLRLPTGNLIGELRTMASQSKSLRENYAPDSNRLIVFLVPGYDGISGGLLSIASIYEETKRIRDIHHAETAMCTLPWDPLLLKYTKFRNGIVLYRFRQVLRYFRRLEELTIHIPEFAVGQFARMVSPDEIANRGLTTSVHVNVLIQNPTLLQERKSVRRLQRYGTVTCTTAHARYSSPDMRKDLGVPLHKLSVYVSPELYKRTPYSEKEDLLVVSPDSHPRRAEILGMVSNRNPSLKVQVINNLTYEEYKETIERAKWALTFGEGLDGYFVETVFSGGVSFGIFNDTFFTEDFQQFRTVYDSFDTLANEICSDIADLDNATSYARYQQEQYAACAKLYRHEDYVRNLRLFYEGKYTYP